MKLTNRVLAFSISKNHPYFNLMQVQEIYKYLNGGSKIGLAHFSEKAKLIAYKNPETHAYAFRDEDKLFQLFRESLPYVFEKRKFTCFGEIMQLIS